MSFLKNPIYFLRGWFNIQNLGSMVSFLNQSIFKLGLKKGFHFTSDIF
jgi:hypothetical protein